MVERPNTPAPTMRIEAGGKGMVVMARLGGWIRARGVLGSLD